jgi:site-specific recombinase XerD
VTALRAHRRQQAETRLRAGDSWVNLHLVFCTQQGTPLDAANVRRHFRAVARAAGLDADQWTELRHSFVSLLSSTGLSIEDISHLVGHANTHVTESIYLQGTATRSDPRRRRCGCAFPDLTARTW